MAKSLFEQLDLNLLRAFNAIYQLKNTTLAAKKLGLSQSGTSHALKRLREQLDDPLFIRVGNQLEPTARAHQLGKTLQGIMAQLEDSCYPSELFDAGKYQGKISIVVSGALIDAFGKALVTCLCRQLPQAEINLRHWSAGTLSDMESGDVDIGINHYPLNLGNNIRQITVTQDPSVLLMREGHPFQHKKFTLEHLSQVPLAGLILPELTDFQQIIETEFKEMGFHFALRSDHLPTLYEYLLETDLIMTPPGIAASTRPEGIIALRPDFASMAPVFSIAIYHNQRNSQHPLYQWLVAQLRTVIETVSKQTSFSYGD